MGNPQERSLAWFTGIIEGEGSISVQVYTLPDGRVRLTPYVSIINTDRVILDECDRIFKLLLENETSKARYCGHSRKQYDYCFQGRKLCYALRADGNACGAVLKAILPYMVGEKRRNAEVVLQYIESRKHGLLLRDTKGRLQRQGYTRQEIELVSSIRSHSRAKSSETICQAPNVIG